MNRTLTTESESRRCYVILESEQGEHGYIPSLVIEDEPGYSPMTGDDDQEPWYWGKTRGRANAVCARYNRQHFGISQCTADRIVASSMKAQNISA